MDSLLAAYQQAKPSVRINASYAPTDQVQTSLRTQLGAGNAPDLHVVYPGSGSAMSMTQIGKAGLLADLSAQPWTQTIPDRVQARLPARRQDLHLLGRLLGHRRDLQQEGLREGGRRRAADHLDRVPRRLRQAEEGGHRPDRAGRADAVGHPAHHVRAGALHRLRQGPDVRRQAARRSGHASPTPAGATPWRCTWSCRSAASSTTTRTAPRSSSRPRWSATGKAAHGDPGVGRAARLPQGGRQPRTTCRCSRCPGPTTPPRVDPGRRRRRDRRQRQGQERRGGEGVHRLPRQAGEHQRLGQGGRRASRCTQDASSKIDPARGVVPAVHQGPGGAVHGPALAQRRGPADPLRGRPGAARAARPRSTRR